MFEIEKDIWFDSEKLYILNGKENYEKYMENYEKYDFPRQMKKGESYPVITFLSTTCCNLKCTYCYAGQGTYNNVSKENTFSVGNYIKAYECVLSEYGGVKGICFFGGEPLLNYVEIKKFVEYLFDKYDASDLPRISIGSNGTIMNKEILDFIVRYNIAFGTSLDGPKVHNDLCRVGDEVTSVYDKVITTINELGKKNVLVSLQFTFNKIHLENYKKGDVIEWISDFEKLPIAFYEIIAATTDNELNHINLEDEKIYSNYLVLCNDLAEHSLNSIMAGKTTIMSVIFSFLILSIANRRIAGHCGAGKNITISPDMRVYPCHVIASNRDNSIDCLPGFKEEIITNAKFNEIINLNRDNVFKCQKCIAKNLCSVFCKGLCNCNSDVPPEERCLMMRIFVEKTISFMINEYPNNKAKIVKSVKSILEAHGVI